MTEGSKRWMLGCAIAGLLLAMVGCPAGNGDGRGAASRPDIVLVTVDGLVPDQMSLFGGELETPILTALAESGRAWSDGMTAVPMTRPGVATYLTGLGLAEHNVRDDILHGLDDSIPTLAERLAAAGYATVALPDAASLGVDSGLHRGFDVVRDPPKPPLFGDRFLPTIHESKSLAESVGAYLEGVPTEQPVFAWIHLSSPYYEQMVIEGKLRDGGATETEDTATEESAEAKPEGGLSRLDRFVGGVFDAFRVANRWDGSLIVVAGNLGQVAGNPDEIQGAGFSMSPAALRVPIIARGPEELDRDAGDSVWSPDVTATIAAAAGIESLGAGVPLTEPGGDRVLHAASWALLDQMNWKPIRAARHGPWFLRDDITEGFSNLDGDGVDGDDDVRTSLEATLADLDPAPRVAIESEKISQILVDLEINQDPSPLDGRSFGDPASRKKVADLIWRARRAAISRDGAAALRGYRQALARDPSNYAAMLDFVQIQALSGISAGERIFKRLMAGFAEDPEALH
ncbi:MAG: sulfatase-like hydrolase/transferase, partial [Acidobacteriota bacterium]|nr:sulfatase-like hydrolase/transferase [Acidobacteriota bacterium]